MNYKKIEPNKVYSIKNSPFKFKVISVLPKGHIDNPLQKILVKGYYSPVYGKINWELEQTIRYFKPLTIG